MATKEEKYKNLNEQQKRAVEKMTIRQRLRSGFPAQLKRQNQIAKPETQETRKNARLAAEVLSYAIPGLGMAKITAKLATLAPKAIKNLKAAVGKNNIDAVRLALGIDKRVGGTPKTKIIKSAGGKKETVVQTTPGNLVKPRFGKGPDGRPLGARPVGKGVVKKAKNIRRGAAATAAVAGTAAVLTNGEKKKPVPKKRIEKPTTTTPTIETKKPRKEPTVSATKTNDPTEGGRYAFYPGKISRKEGYETMYEVDRNKMSDEVRERLEEAEDYEGDSKGGRVGKGKKKKVSKAPRGVRAALRGFKPNIGASKGNKRTRGTGGGWV